MKEKILAVLLLVLAVILVYGNSLETSFHYDDVPPIIDSAALHDLGNWFDILTGQRGLGMLSLAINYAISGQDAYSYHLFNVSIHIVNVILVFLLCSALLVTGAARGGGASPCVAAVPFFTALLFAVHPLQTQAVTYIVQRMECLAALFALLGLFGFVIETQKGRPVRAGAWVLVCLFVGYTTKETIIVLPLLVLLVDWLWLSNGSWRQLLSRRWVHAPLLASMLLLVGKTLFFLKGAVAADSVSGTVKATAGFAVSSISSWEYALTQSNVLLYYISLVLLPLNQNLDYDFPIARDPFSWPVVREGTVLNWTPLPPVLALGLLLAMLSGACYWYRRSRNSGGEAARITLFGLLWFLIAIAPTSSIIPVIDVIYEHRAYLPSLGIILIVTYGLDRLSSRWLAKRDAAPEDGTHGKVT